MTTVNDIIEYVIKNKRGNAFKDMDNETIIHHISQALSYNALSYSLNEKTFQVNGVAIGAVYPEERVFFVTHTLTTEKKVLAALLMKFLQLFPGYKLEAKRHGRIVRYDTKKFIERVTTMTLKGVI